MKKLNRKGFTLIELLAVIVILAIVMVVTIPSVLSSMDKAKTGQLQNSADSVAEWFQKQYDNAKLGSLTGGAEASYNTFLGKNGEKQNVLDSSGKSLNATVLKAAGLTNTTGISGTVKYDDTKAKVCVTLTAAENSSFYVAPYTKDGETVDPNTVTNSGCK